MISTQKNSEVNDEMENLLEKKFLDINFKLPFPNKDNKKIIDEYSEEIQEIMKTGCSRQIAEYSMIEYNNGNIDKKLYKLKKQYKDYKNEISIINNTCRALVLSSDLKNKQFNYNIDNIDIINFVKSEDEIEEILSDENVNKKLEELYKSNEYIKSIENKVDKQKIAFYFLNKQIEELKEEEKKNFIEKQEQYFNEREAVIESALRRVKNIVNDDNEFKKFHDKYYKEIV